MLTFIDIEIIRRFFFVFLNNNSLFSILLNDVRKISVKLFAYYRQSEYSVNTSEREKRRENQALSYFLLFLLVFFCDIDRTFSSVKHDPRRNYLTGIY